MSRCSRPGTIPAAATAILLACHPLNPAQNPLPDPVYTGDPTITELGAYCDVDDAQWQLLIRTDRWTGGARFWMRDAAGELEAHRIGSASAAADGSSDCLDATLNVATDPQNAASGSSSRWRCADAAALTFMVAVKGADGGDWADCRTWGADPTGWGDVDDVPDCMDLADRDTGRSSPGDCD